MQSVSAVHVDSMDKVLHLATVKAIALFTGLWVHTCKATFGFSFGDALYVL